MDCVGRDDSNWPWFGIPCHADGSVVVGYTEGQIGPQLAFRWTAATGMQVVQDVLSAGGIDMRGWTLTFPTGVSADGETIVGEGTPPTGYYEGWIAHIPVNAFALLDLAGTDHSIGSLVWGGTVTNSGVASPATLTAGSDNTSTTFNGSLDGTSQRR